MRRTLPIADSLVGKVIADRYRVVRRIGAGGMGTVYEVAHTRLKRNFAIKTLAPQLRDGSQALARFRREADIVAQLRHPHIVDVVDWDALPDGTPCLVMELLEGEPLSERIKRQGALVWPAIARIAESVLSALHAAHQAGVVHRDLKPQNVFLERDSVGEEHVKLLDFGIAKAFDAPLSDISSAAGPKMIGTPPYMSPEQLAAEPVGPATDVWAMGVLLYRIAAGRLPFDGPNVAAISAAVNGGPPPPLTSLRADAPEGFADAVHGAISRGRNRILTAEELREAVRESLVTIAPHAVTNPIRLARDVVRGARIHTASTVEVGRDTIEDAPVDPPAAPAARTTRNLRGEQQAEALAGATIPDAPAAGGGSSPSGDDSELASRDEQGPQLDLHASARKRLRSIDRRLLVAVAVALVAVAVWGYVTGGGS